MSLQGFLADKSCVTLLADVRSLVQVNTVNVHGELETVGITDITHGAGEAEIKMNILLKKLIHQLFMIHLQYSREKN